MFKLPFFNKSIPTSSSSPYRTSAAKVQPLKNKNNKPLKIPAMVYALTSLSSIVMIGTSVDILEIVAPRSHGTMVSLGFAFVFLAIFSAVQAVMKWRH